MAGAKAWGGLGKAGGSGHVILGSRVQGHPVQDACGCGDHLPLTLRQTCWKGLLENRWGNGAGTTWHQGGSPGSGEKAATRGRTGRASTMCCQGRGLSSASWGSRLGARVLLFTLPNLLVSQVDGVQGQSYLAVTSMHTTPGGKPDPCTQPPCQMPWSLGCLFPPTQYPLGSFSFPCELPG